MTTERDKDPDATVEMPRLVPKVDEDLEDVDPEDTLVRENWESTVIRRVAPRVAAVRREVDEDETRFGWEREGLRRLAQEIPKSL